MSCLLGGVRGPQPGPPVRRPPRSSVGRPRAGGGSRPILPRQPLPHGAGPSWAAGQPWQQVAAAAAGVGSVAMDELELQAKQLLPAGVYDYFAGGADDELTLADNEAAWRRLALRPRVLRDVASVDPSTSVLGTPVAGPG